MSRNCEVQFASVAIDLRIAHEGGPDGDGGCDAVDGNGARDWNPPNWRLHDGGVQCGSVGPGRQNNAVVGGRGNRHEGVTRRRGPAAHEVGESCQRSITATIARCSKSCKPMVVNYAIKI